MKVILFTISLIILCTAMFANPLMPNCISEIWIAENGHLMLELNSAMVSYYDSLLYVSTNEYSTHYPFDYQSDVNLYDLSQVIEGDSLFLMYRGLILSYRVEPQSYIVLDRAEWRPGGG